MVECCFVRPTGAPKEKKKFTASLAVARPQRAPKRPGIRAKEEIAEYGKAFFSSLLLSCFAVVDRAGLVSKGTGSIGGRAWCALPRRGLVSKP